MLNQGKISVDEAEKLLDSTHQSETHAEDKLTSTKLSINKKFLRVFVLENNKTKVNINIPIALAEVGLKLIPKDKLKIQEKEIDVDEIVRLIQEGNEGELLNIETTDKGKKVKARFFIQ